jgi:hypothetical protein
MFTLSKSTTELTYDTDAHKYLGSKLNEIGGRVLLISSLVSEDREKISLIKKELTTVGVTYIQCNQPFGFVTKDDLEQLQLRAENFNISTVVSVGDTAQRMSGRFIAQKLALNYYEIPTQFSNPYLLIPTGIYSNRVVDDFEKIFLAQDLITEIIIDKSLMRKMDQDEIKLEAFSILLDLAHFFTSKENNFVSVTESKNLFLRLLNDIENSTLDLEKLHRYDMTCALYHGASNDIELSLKVYSWIAGQRFSIHPNLIAIKLLASLLLIKDEEKLSSRIRKSMDRLSISTRLTDLGLTLSQVIDITKDNPLNMEVVKKAF